MKKLSQYTKYHILHTGFTLIEMLVVISIIGILATLVAANLNSARSRARDAQRKSDIKNIETALRLYYNDNGSYPNANALPWGGAWTSGNTTYMEMLPKDPLSPTQDYHYALGASTDNYTLYACLENSSDTNGIPSGGLCSSGTMFQITQ